MSNIYLKSSFIWENKRSWKAFQAWRSNAVLLRNQFSNMKMCLYYHLEEMFYITSKMIDIRSEQLLVLFLFHIEINQRKY